MSQSFNKWTLFGFSSGLLLLLILTSLFFIPYLYVKYMVIIVGSILEILLIISLYRYERFVQSQLCLLSDALDSYIVGKPKVPFSDVEDKMLSKIQKQMMVLDDIWIQRYNLERIEKERLNSLISDISHQLKTPLANLKLYDELIQSEGITHEELKKFYSNKYQQIIKLEWLIEVLVKISKIETGIIELHKRNVSLNEVLLSSINMMVLKAEEKDIDIRYQISRDIPVFVDPKWLSEAIFNLLDNSVKYSEKGSVVLVKVEVVTLFIRIDIEDQGITIDPSEYNNIFKRFYRISNTSQEDGLGIGLYMSRNIVSRHDGYIVVEAIEKGNRFSVFLPMKDSCLKE